MKITKSQMTSILFSLLFFGCSIASAEYKPYTNTEQETKQQKMEKRQQKREAKKEKKEMKQKGMKEKAKSYSAIVLEQAEVLNLTDEQLGKIMRIQMNHKKARKELLDSPRKSMTKALKELRNPGATVDSIRKAGRAHTDDFDALVEAEIIVRKNIDATLTAEQRKKLQAIKLPVEEKMND
ncbi:hypothetical protein AU255_08015 [Methyloprofundus sedimenti]|uniref:Zinc resistance-associated protein n=1 Tax=Methyloprofundus sedimenti TaxID=1420851 RepID=A0A1V8M8C1_9GAMM|nr:Spy/CpxP family protein refolding chaperone [Methyloprofundus sedimenti]OQK17795.1 hypothetical protein AU255_08015 [Methyloprofundus sedimenti]